MRKANMKIILVVSLFVALLTVFSVDAQDEYPRLQDLKDRSRDKTPRCTKKFPKAKKLGISCKKQSYSVRKHIAYELWKYKAIKADVYRIAKEYRVEYKSGSHYYDAYVTCPSRIKYVTAVKYLRQYCYVVYPQYIPYAVCKKRSCYQCRNRKSGCFQDHFRRFKFWVYCRGKGFYLVEKYLPQCCSCYYYFYCSKTA